MRSHSLRSRVAPLLLLGAIALAACGGDDASKPASGGGGTAGAAAGTVSRYAMPADPTGAISVLEAKKAAPKKDVVVVGRIKDMTPGFAAFTMTDVSLKYCGQETDEACPTPWDYCCIDSGEVAAATVAVAAKEKGDVVMMPRIPELRNGDLVAVAGTLTKVKDDVILEATGWHRRERPTFGAHVKFP